jgi:hypothetical protein
MALRFALRSRIRLREMPTKAETRRLPPFAVPVAMYWAVVGLAIWGIEARWHPEQWLSVERDSAPHFDATPRSWADAPRDLSVNPLDREPPALAATPPPDPQPASIAGLAPDPSSEPLSPPWPPRGGAPPTAASLRDPSMPVAGFDPARTRSAPPNVRSRKLTVLHFDPIPSVTTDDDTSPIPESPRQEGLAALGHRAVSPSDRTSEPERPTAATRATRSVAASCEAALENAHQDVDLTTGRGAPDVTRDAYASLLDRGTYLAPCDVPGDTALDLCVAVQDGRAIGVTVTATPGNSRVVACVRRALSGFAFPVSARMDVARTRFAPAAH